MNLFIFPHFVGGIPKEANCALLALCVKWQHHSPEGTLGFSFTTVNNPRKIDIAILTFYSGKCINGGLASDLPILPAKVGK